MAAALGGVGGWGVQEVHACSPTQAMMWLLLMWPDPARPLASWPPLPVPAPPAGRQQQESGWGWDPCVLGSTQWRRKACSALQQLGLLRGVHPSVAERLQREVAALDRTLGIGI